MGYQLQYILQSLPLYVVVLAVIYVVGTVLNKWLSIFNDRTEGVAESAFYNSLTGLVAVFMLYAIVATKGISIFSPLLILLGIYYFIIRKKADAVERKSEHNLKSYVPVIAALIGCYAWSFFLTTPDNVSGVIHTYYDYSYYANTSEGMAKTGVEYSKLAMYQFDSFKGSFLYHYPDMWLTALLINLTGFGSMPMLLYVVYPVFMFVAFAGCVVLTKTIAAGRISTNLLYIAVPAILGGVLLAKGNVVAKNMLPGMGSGIDQYMFHWLDKKMLIIYIVATLAILQLFKHNYEAFFAAMLACMYFYATVVPAVAGGLAGVLLILFLFDKSVNLRRAMLLGALFVIALIVVVLFDKFTSQYPRPALDAATMLPVKSLVILVMEFCIKIAVGALPVVAALAVLWYITGRKLHSSIYYLIVFLAGACGATSLFISLNHHVTDINQALYTSVPVFISLFALVVFIKLFAAIQQKYVQGLLLLALLISTGFKLSGNIHEKESLVKDNYSVVFEASVLKEINGNPKAKIVVLSNDENHNRWYYHFNPAGAFTGQTRHTGESLYIHPYFTTDSVRNAFWTLPNNIDDPVKRWFAAMQKSGQPTDMKSFLRTQEITYLFAEDANLVKQYGLEGIVKMVDTDANTGHIFYRIDAASL